MGLRVKCTNCGEVRHETTEHYNPDVTPKGNFVRLIEPWKKWRWNCFDDQGENTSTTSCSMMTCPGCAAALAPSGRLTVLEKVKTLAEINQENMDAFEGEDTSFEPEKPKIVKKANPLQCEVCGKTCKSPLGLLSHMRTHKKKVDKDV